MNRNTHTPRAIALAAFLSLSFAVPLTANEKAFPGVLAPATVRPSKAGALKIIAKGGKAQICGRDGTPVQLRGMSTHGLQWFPQILNDNAFRALAVDWGSNVVRLAMYVTENGYASNPVVKDRLVEGVRLAIKHDMYAIVDWHVLSPGDPNAKDYALAREFFREISALFPNDPHVIYELCNEPNGNRPGVSNDEAGWRQVKKYAEPIVKELRASGNQNLIIVGSPNWSQRPDLAADDPIDDANVAYAFHFYSGSHLPGAYVWQKVEYALEKGVALFCSEWGTSEANGDGGPYLDEADAWIDMMNRNGIGWINWSMTTKSETSGAFRPYMMGAHEAASLDPGPDGKWAPDELSPSGEYARARIKGARFVPVARKGVSAVPIEHAEEGYATFPSDFEDGTRQGWSWFGGSPVQSPIIVAKAGGSKALGWAVAYPEAKPEGDWTTAPRIMVSNVNVSRKTARYLAFDFLVKPERASRGALGIVLAMAPPSLGYWAQAEDDFVIDLEGLASAERTADGLYRWRARFDLTKLKEGKKLKADTTIRDLTVVVVDKGSDFAGTMFIDNVRFEESPR